MLEYGNCLARNSKLLWIVVFSCRRGIDFARVTWSSCLHRLTCLVQCLVGVAVITGLGYPSRVAITMLSETYTDFMGKYGADAMSAKENALNRKAKTMLSSVCTKYEDSTSIDKAQSVLSKVDGVKAQMQDNIAGMLKNTEKAESLADKSDQLNEQAAVFKKNSKDLKRQMKCKNLKMTLLLTFLVVGILVVILVPLIRRAKNK